MCIKSVFVCVCVSSCFSWPAIVLTALKALLCFVMSGSCHVMSMTPWRQTVLINTEMCFWYCMNINYQVQSYAAATTKNSSKTELNIFWYSLEFGLPHPKSQGQNYPPLLHLLVFFFVPPPHFPTSWNQNLHKDTHHSLAHKQTHRQTDSAEPCHS